ncbi:unnamed protein product [Sphagnum jensenii]
MRFAYDIRAVGALLLLFNSSLFWSSFASPSQVQARSSRVEDELVTRDSLPDFRGRALLVLSDGDQSATAYADGLLDRPDGVADTLTVVPCPPEVDRPGRAIAVSNSVLGWPQALAVAPDRKYAYIVETRSAPMMGKVKDVLKALPEGHLLTTVDLSDLAALKIVDQRPIGVDPWTVDVSPDGKTLAVDTRQDDANLLLIDLVNGHSGGAD